MNVRTWIPIKALPLMSWAIFVLHAPSTRRGSSGVRITHAPHNSTGPSTTLRLPGPLLHSRCVGTVYHSRPRSLPPPPPSPALRRLPRPRPAPPLQSPHSSCGCNRQSRRTNGAAAGDGAGPRARPFPALSSRPGRVIPGQGPDFVLVLTLPGP